MRREERLFLKEIKSRRARRSSEGETRVRHGKRMTEGREDQGGGKGVGSQGLSCLFTLVRL